MFPELGIDHSPDVLLKAPGHEDGLNGASSRQVR
jgi:hypothetical protein